jgi:hypothetical protein
MDIARKLFNAEGTLQGVAIWLAGRGPDGKHYDPPVTIFCDDIEAIAEDRGEKGLQDFLMETFRQDDVQAFVIVYRAVLIPPGTDLDKARESPDRQRLVLCALDHADQEAPVLYTAEVFQGDGQACIAGFECRGPVTEGYLLGLLPTKRTERNET